MRPKKQERQKARDLRQQGWPLESIRIEIGVAKSSVSTWVRDIKPTPDARAQFRAQQENSRELRKQGRLVASIARELSVTEQVIGLWTKDTKPGTQQKPEPLAKVPEPTTIVTWLFYYKRIEEPPQPVLKIDRVPRRMDWSDVRTVAYLAGHSFKDDVRWITWEELHKKDWPFKEKLIRAASQPNYPARAWEQLHAKAGWPPIFEINEFEALLLLLNSVTGPHGKWHWQSANKRHTDQFGVPIFPSSAYLIRALDPIQWDNVVRLSYISACRLLQAIFIANIQGKTIAEAHLSDHQRAIMAHRKRRIDQLKE